MLNRTRIPAASVAARLGYEIISLSFLHGATGFRIAYNFPVSSLPHRHSVHAAVGLFLIRRNSNSKATKSTTGGQRRPADVAIPPRS